MFVGIIFNKSLPGILLVNIFVYYKSFDLHTVVDVQVAQISGLGWEYFTGVSGVMEILENCLKGWIVQIGGKGESYPKFYHLDLIASCFQLFSTFVQRYTLSNSYKPIDFINWLEDLIHHIKFDLLV